jgi:hypothetical protein
VVLRFFFAFQIYLKAGVNQFLGAKYKWLPKLAAISNILQAKGISCWWQHILISVVCTGSTHTSSPSDE